MHKVLAIMESNALSSALERALGEEFALTRCGDAASGAELLENTPDALILDLFLPGVTGLTFLEENRERLPPAVLVLSPLITPYVVQSAERLGAGFLIRMPCTPEEIARHLREMMRKPDPSDRIRDLLLTLRISPRLLGFLYLTEILRLFSADKQQRVTKDLYPVLARKHRTSPDAVEHAIRSCLRDAWNRRDPEIWQHYFPGAQRCPSNREFIAVLAEFAQKTPFPKEGQWIVRMHSE